MSAVAYWLLQSAPGIYDDWPIGQWLGVVLLTLLIVGSVYGWGILIARRLTSDTSLIVPFGTATLCLFGLLLLSVGAVGASAQPLWIGALLIGFLWFRFPKLPWASARALAPLALLLLPLTLLALTPQAHPDPLFYHLLSLRRWYEDGKLLFVPEQPLLFQTGLWEHLYLFPLEFLAPAPEGQLIAVQLVSQLLHLWLGWAGCFFLLRAVLQRRGFAQVQVWSLLLLAQPLLLEVAVTAKNDWGTILWSLAALALIEQRKSSTELIFAGLLLGLAWCNRWPSALGIFPLLAYLFWSLRSENTPLRARAFCAFWVLLAFILGCLPIYYRNYQFTGNPFFPAFARTLSAKLLSPTDQFLLGSYGDAFRTNGAPQILGSLFRILISHPLTLCCLLLPLAWRKGWLERAWKPLALLVSLFAIITAWILHPAMTPRISGPLLILLSLIGFACVHPSPWRKALSARLPTWGHALLWTAMFLWLGLSVPLTWPFQQPAQVIRAFPAGDAMQWLRARRASLNGVVAFGGNPQLYYMDGIPALMPETDPALDAVLSRQTDVRGVVRALREHGVGLFVETAAAMPMGRYAGFFGSLAAAGQTSAIVFASAGSRVWDLAALERMMESPRWFPPPYRFGGLLLDPQK